MENERKIVDDLKELVESEANSIMLMGATFYRLETEIKNNNYENFKKNIENQLKINNIKEEKYKDDIKQMLAKYEEVMNRISNIYEIQYETIQELLQENETKQNEMISELLELKYKKIDDKERLIKEKLEEKSKYDVIVYECTKRLEECLENMQASLSRLNEDSKNVAKLVSDSLFKKIKLFFKKIFVKPNFEKSIKSEKAKYLKKITKESKDVERYITYKIKEFEYQVTHIERQK